MPRITTISVHNSGSREGQGLKRQLFARTLSGCDLLVGPNGAGKTTQGPLAVTAAIEGLAEVPTDTRRPYLGARPLETSITVELDNGDSLTRDLSSTRGKETAHANQRARDLIGIPPTAWDLTDFAMGTDGDRGRILDAVARAGGSLQRWDAETAYGAVESLMIDGQPEGAEHWMEPLATFAAFHRKAPDGATWLKSAESWTVEEQKRTNAEQKAARNHADELGQTVPARVDGSAEKDAVAAGALRAELADIANRDRAVEAVRRHEAEGKRLAEEVKAITAEGKRLAEPLPPLAPVYQERVDEAAAALDQPLEAVDYSALELDIEAAQATHDAAVEARAAMGPKRDEAKREAERTAVMVTTGDATIRALEKAADPDATCTHCGAADPLGLVAELERARTATEEARTDAAAAKDAEAVVLAEYADADLAVRDAHRSLVEARAALTAAKAATPDVKEDRKRALSRARADLEREQGRHEQAEARRKADLEAARQRYARAAAALESWQTSATVNVPDAADPGREQEIRDELSAIESRQASRAARAAHVEQTRRAVERADETRAIWEAVRGMLAAVRQARDDMAAAAYKPIEDAAARLFDGAVGMPQPYFTSTADYGAEVPGRGRVPFHGLSESEQRITAAALVYALAVAADLPVRLVLLDGIEVVQLDHRLPLLGALAAAVKRGDVDNVICTMATAPGEDLTAYQAVEGLTIAEVERADLAEPVMAPTPAVEPEPAPDVSADCPF